MSRSEKMKGNKNGHGNKGRTFRPETLLKMSLAKKGKTSNFKGKKLSLESREKMRQSKIKFLSKKFPDYVPNYLNLNSDGKRKQRILFNGGCHSIGEWETLKVQYNFTCPSCKKQEPEVKLTRDHIVPISRGGSDNIENIQPLCSLCNTLKATITKKY